MSKYLIIPMAFFFVFLWSQLTVAEPLNLSKSDALGQGECAVSDKELTYTLCYDNLTNQDDGVYNVSLNDKLPADVGFISADNEGEYDSATHSVTWDVGSLGAGAVEECVSLTIKVNALPGAVLSNQATIVSTVSTQPEEVSNAEEISTICPVFVSVDIKPGGCPTPINVGSKGVLPVAVLGTKDFDVAAIDPQSITLEGVSPLRWEIEDVATPYSLNVDECNIRDCHELTGDGYSDLTLKFDTQEIYEAIADVYDRECLILELTGNLKTAYGDLPIKGGDVVSILKKGRKHNVVPVNFILSE